MVSIGIVEVHLHLQVHQEASSFQVEENFQVVVVGIDDVVDWYYEWGMVVHQYFVGWG